MRNPRRRGGLTALATLFLSSLFVVATAGPAAAHDEFLSSTPEAGDTLPAAPTELTLAFSGELNSDPASAVIEVIGTDGRNIATDPPAIAGTNLTQPVRQDTPAGPFTVRWKVVSSDGHPISGEFGYTVQAAPAAVETPTPEATPEQTAEPAPTHSDTPGTGGRGVPTEAGALLPIVAVISGVVVLGGLVIVVLFMARERRRRDIAAGTPTTGGTAGKTDET
ncbi:copper resistance CopC family protein [Microbacterium yannicii]|uniref:copper resistance CopC family protein n=1 Tax=Microbacterium yannicii TaxID=671622 RepID=UPI00031D3F0D|nr:copper resistance CopC family protein [Microbacterium yannicii]